MTITTSSTVQHTVHDEMILVVKRSAFFAQTPAWQGIKKVDFDQYLDLIKQQQEFQPRSQMEIDPTYKQIIPYLIFQHDDRYFLMQRQAKATETRLQNKFSLGIGGHIQQEDLSGGTIFDWARREFYEEVTYNGTFTVEPLGIINDDSTPVGQVHVGFVFLLKGDSDQIQVQSELKSGVLLSLDENKAFYDRMETWTQMVFDFLQKTNEK